jgi:hypothetical protein
MVFISRPGPNFNETIVEWPDQSKPFDHPVPWPW